MQFGKTIEDIENDYICGIDKYPKTLVDAYSLMTHWKQDPNNLMRILESSDNGVAFPNVSQEPGRQQNARGAPRDKPNVKCYHCQEMGHYSNECPVKATEEERQESGDMHLNAGAEDDEYDDWETYI
jgi:hypothetical protein